MPQESELVEAHIPCPDTEGCGSSDGAALYDDSHIFCYVCQQSFNEAGEATSGEGRANPQPTSDCIHELIASSNIQNLPRRGITQATAEHWDYRVRINSHGEGEHIAVYRDEHRQPVAAKIRNLGKDGTGKEFSLRPNMKQDGEDAPKDLLYGIQFLRAGGKMLVVAEGEIDAMTISQLWSNSFPVISPPLGAPSAAKMLAKHLAAISRYDKVVFCFDMDEPGQDAAVACAKMLAPGKAFIASLPLKDPNEMHLAGRDKELMAAIHNAAPYRPDGILDADEVDHELDKPTQRGSPFAFDFITRWTYGKRPGEVIVLGAGTGVGKTDWETEEVAHCIKPLEHGGCYEPTAVFNFEAGAAVTLRAVLSKLWSLRFNIPPPEDGSANPYWSQDQFNAARAYRRDKCAKLFINDSKGAADWDAVEERLRYLRHAYGITTAWVDPMAALAADEMDDRKALDHLMARAKAVAEELGLTIIFMSHLARPKEGRSHEEGGRVRLSQFRGSNAIGMWASFVFAEERNQQEEPDEETGEVPEDITTFRCLKDRYTGDATGLTQALRYNTITGRLEIAEYAPPEERLSSMDNPPDAPPSLDGYV